VDDYTRAVIAAATSVSLHDPQGTAVLLVFGKGAMLWEDPGAGQAEKPVSPEKATPIDRALLAGVEDREPVRSADQNPREYHAFNHVLLKACRIPAEALAKAARRDLTYAHLFEEPAKYRGQIVHIEGRLRRLRKFDTNQEAANACVPVQYEGWIFDEHAYGNPYCVVITKLPAGLELGDDIHHEVAFDGYFFKRYRYKAGDGLRDAPLLIGRTLIVRPSAQGEPEAALSIPDWLLWSFLSLLIATFLVGIGLAWVFRRGDRQVRSRLEQNRNARFVAPGEADQP
jgi:hypothetical protein